MALNQITSSGQIKQGVTGASQVLYDSGALAAPAASLDSGAGGFVTTFNNLTVYYVARGDQAAATISALIRLNGDSGANYSWQGWAYVGGANGSRGNVTGQTSVTLNDGVPAATATAGFAGVGQILIPMYSGTAFHKAFYAAHGGGNDQMMHESGTWHNTGAVTRVQIIPSAGNWIAGSRMIIYGSP